MQPELHGPPSRSSHVYQEPKRCPWGTTNDLEDEMRATKEFRQSLPASSTQAPWGGEGDGMQESRVYAMQTPFHRDPSREASRNGSRNSSRNSQRSPKYTVQAPFGTEIDFTQEQMDQRMMDLRENAMAKFKTPFGTDRDLPEKKQNTYRVIAPFGTTDSRSREGKRTPQPRFPPQPAPFAIGYEVKELATSPRPRFELKTPYPPDEYAERRPSPIPFTAPVAPYQHTDHIDEVISAKQGTVRDIGESARFAEHKRMLVAKQRHTPPRRPDSASSTRSTHTQQTHTQRTHSTYDSQRTSTTTSSRRR